MKQAALSICFPTAAEQRVLHQMLLLHPLKIQIVAEETEQTNSLKHHAELSQWVFRHAALVAAQGTNTAVLYYLLHTTDYSAPVLNALLVALCHSLFTPLTRTRQNSLVLSWPSFQFATVQSQIPWGLLKNWKFETGLRQDKTVFFSVVFTPLTHTRQDSLDLSMSADWTSYQCTAHKKTHMQFNGHWLASTVIKSSQMKPLRTAGGCVFTNPVTLSLWSSTQALAKTVT